MTRRLKSVEIKNVKGIESLTFSCGAVTVLRGKNGAGKSSAIDALIAVFEGGHDPGLIRTGAKEGSVVLLLDDGVTIKKVIKPERSTLEVRTADKGKVQAEATYVKRLASGLRFNPAAFISMSGRERAAELGKVMPVTFTGKEVNAAANEAILADGEVIDQRRFTEIRDGRYATRTDVAREQTMAEGFIVSTEAALPTGSATSWTGIVEMLRVQTGEAKADLEREKADLDKAKQAELADEAERFAEAKHALVARYEADLEKLKVSNAKTVDEIKERYQGLEWSTVNLSTGRFETLAGELAKAEQSLADQNRVEGQRQQLAKMRENAQGLQKRWVHLDAAVKGLDRLKSEKLAKLPVPGVEVRLDDKNMPEVYVDNVPWEHVNKSMQCKIAITIASQALGELPLMVLDESEVLDADSMQLLIDAAKGIGMQIIMARVESGTELQAVEA
jgi:hypothetical protein